MADPVLPVSNIVNVTITDTPQGLTSKNVNSIGLFTTETPGNNDEFRNYVSVAEVEADYGTGSVAAAMASNVFAQSPNPLSGGGRLVIIPLLASVSATSGDFTTADISANLAALIVVADGDIRITLNGSNIDLTGVDFTNQTTLAGVAEVLQASLPNTIVTATATAIKVEAKNVGAASDVDIVQLPAGAGTDLSAGGLLNVVAGTATSGADSSGETIAAAITRTESTAGYVGVITNLEMEDAVVTTLAAVIQAKDLIFVHHFADVDAIAGIITTVSGASQDQVRCLFYSRSKTLGNLMKAAYAGGGFSVNFAGSNTVSTRNLKTLINVTSDAINQTNFDAAKTAGADTYPNIQSVSSVVSSGANNFFDQTYNRMALKFDLETGGFNYLKQTNSKIPQTESGMDGLKGAYQDVCTQYVTNGHIGVGLVWNNPDTFGNPEDLRRNINEAGYYIYSLPIAQQSQALRSARQAPLVQIAIKEQGAIHESDVIVLVEA